MMSMVAKLSLFLVLAATQVLAEESIEVDPDAEVVREYFNAPACFLAFREAVEAVLIVSVLLNMLDKSGHQYLKRWVWYGFGAGCLVSVVFGAIIIALFYVAKNQIMSNEGMAIFEGVFSLLASIFLTGVGIGFLRFFNIEDKLRSNFTKEMQQEQEVSDDGKKKGFFAKLLEASPQKPEGIEDEEAGPLSSGRAHYMLVSLTFFAVFREGVEVVIFLAAVGTGLDPTGTAIGGAVGLVAGGIFGIILFYWGKLGFVDLRWFFLVFTAIILVVAGGLAAYGTHEFEELGKPYAYSTNHPIIMRPLYDISGCCSDGVGVGAMLRALVGYQDKPTLAEATIYLAYWMFVIVLITYRFKEGILFMGKSRRKQLNQQGKPSPVSSEAPEMSVADQPVPSFMMVQQPHPWMYGTQPMPVQMPPQMLTQAPMYQ